MVMSRMITGEKVFEMMAQLKSLHCCGKKMSVLMDLGKFWEVHCNVCNDVIYVKKPLMAKPQMIDD